MRKKQSLQRALAISLALAGSIYCHAAWAADGTDGADIHQDLILTDSAISNPISITGNDGTAGDDMSSAADTRPYRGGKGGDVTVSAVSSSDLSSNINISITSGAGGSGGYSWHYDNPISYYSGMIYGGNGGDAGAAQLELVVQGDSITHQDITLMGQGADGSYAGENGYVTDKFTTADTGKGQGGAGGNADVSIRVQSTSYTANDITLTAQGGRGGAGKAGVNGSNSVNTDDYFEPDVDLTTFSAGNGGVGGKATASGLLLDSASTLVSSITAHDLSITANGGQGGTSGYISGGLPGIGGAAEAYGIRAVDMLQQSIAIQANKISVAAAGGESGSYDDESCEVITAIIRTSSEGGKAAAYGIYNQAAAMQLHVTDSLQATATGGQGGEGIKGMSTTDPAGYQGGMGGNGGLATVSAVYNTAGLELSAADITAAATGGKGGKGGNGGSVNGGGLAGAGGIGGLGGNALASGVHNVSGKSIVTADTLTATAIAGQGGALGFSNTTNGTDGQGGNAYAYGLNASGGVIHSHIDSVSAIAQGMGSAAKMSQEAQAYAVYASGNSTVNLYEKTADSGITLAVKATDAQDNETYAVYAKDGASVLFHNDAVLNNDTTAVDNSIASYLNNATLGFGGEATGRTITGGVLNLQGSNTFVVNTDMTNNTPTADKLIFDSLATGSSSAAQYIAVGYDPAIKLDQEQTIQLATPIEILEINNLNGQTLDNFTHKTNTIDGTLYKYEITPDININNNKIEINAITSVKAATPSEGIMAASDAMTGLSNIWRTEGNNLMKRMGDLRSDPEAAKGGVWARYYRGDLSASSSYGRSLEQDYTGFQGGIDKVQSYKGGRLYTGLAVNHIDANSSYNMGRDEASSTGVGLYTSWLGDKGHYVDVILRASRLNSNFKLLDTSGKHINGDYSTWAYGLSAEYGYRHKMQAGWFVEPQAELSLGHINSASYTMSNGAKVDSGSINSVTGRLGFILGKEFTTATRPGNVYFKASALHEFGGKGSLNAYFNNDHINADGAPAMGTWYEVGIGTNLGIAKNSNIYVDALKTFGGKINTKWQINAGVRVSF